MTSVEVVKNIDIEETSFHIVCQYPAFEKHASNTYLIHRYLDCLSEISKFNIERLSSNLSNCNWFLY